MKKLLIVGLLSLVGSITEAGDLSYIWQPNFRIQTVQAACFKPNAPIGDVTACTSVPIIEDGRLGLSYDVGGAFAPGQTPVWVPAGLGYNLLSPAKEALLWTLNHAAPNSFANLKGLLSPAVVTANGTDVQLNIGIKWAWVLSGGKAVGTCLLSVGPRILF